VILVLCVIGWIRAQREAPSQVTPIEAEPVAAKVPA
jgi:hypothetical protein